MMNYINVMRMVKALVKVGDVEVSRYKNTVRITLCNISGFDNNWEVIDRAYNNASLVNTLVSVITNNKGFGYNNTKFVVNNVTYVLSYASWEA